MGQIALVAGAPYMKRLSWGASQVVNGTLETPAAGWSSVGLSTMGCKVVDSKYPLEGCPPLTNLLVRLEDSLVTHPFLLKEEPSATFRHPWGHFTSKKAQLCVQSSFKRHKLRYNPSHGQFQASHQPLLLKIMQLWVHVPSSRFCNQMLEAPSSVLPPTKCP